MNFYFVKKSLNIPFKSLQCEFCPKLLPYPGWVHISTFALFLYFS